MDKRTAAQVVADAILAAPQEERASLALDIIAFATGAVAAIEGSRVAAEKVYRVADIAVGIKQ